jgi:hypothetical protein
MALAFSNGVKSGRLNWSMGVGTVTTNVLQDFRSSSLQEKAKTSAATNSEFEASKVVSIPASSCCIRFKLISKPRTEYRLLKATLKFFDYIQ